MTDIHPVERTVWPQEHPSQIKSFEIRPPEEVKMDRIYACIRTSEGETLNEYIENFSGTITLNLSAIVSENDEFVVWGYQNNNLVAEYTGNVFLLHRLDIINLRLCNYR
ncbi:MAG: hypothetical protein K1000chlam3_01279 [Chlamydiae bacterium]|nr:hypothetical protein [Chlamydiota bacterium]